ncbi:hypothetical protein GUITHDRAFT_99561 [Guillardia theta CCMP2712]|uniref:Cytochrome b5 heme-binding domain-containing protein n=2 Tax=Guillardia theta TaxID=55529 RepID=L1K377_GUITC|nr:hypothetical protein GUITHDRAFT_99561 [Guillardia theta CCMP2712]EKX54910.1 hypothetical protein GUITHDRAFT_99561 [Guillardia theta CCMP2712]|eukprot:XP_005841890.1 hypothetical protein GUITHDRAFT_99561 [Guillardia theta CCMP2712]
MSKEFTREDLKHHDGKVPDKPILVGLRGKVYDVTAGANFYGPGGPYNCFAGRDASRMLGKMQTEPDALDPSTADFGEKELHSLNHWEKFFSDKYSLVGTIRD